MKKEFTLFDIPTLKLALETASVSHDSLASFLDTFVFNSVYETEDNSVVFYADGKNEIEIEFFNFTNPIKRTCSVMYWENGNPTL